MKQVKDWHRLYDDILRCRRDLLQTGTVKYPAQEEVGFLRSAFYRSLIDYFCMLLSGNTFFICRIIVQILVDCSKYGRLNQQ